MRKGEGWPRLRVVSLSGLVLLKGTQAFTDRVTSVSLPRATTTTPTTTHVSRFRSASPDGARSSAKYGLRADASSACGGPDRLEPWDDRRYLTGKFFRGARRSTLVVVAAGGDGGGDVRGETVDLSDGDGGPRKGLLRNLIKRAISTGKIVGQKAGTRIRQLGGDNHDDDEAWYPQEDIQAVRKAAGKTVEAVELAAREKKAQITAKAKAGFQSQAGIQTAAAASRAGTAASPSMTAPSTPVVSPRSSAVYPAAERSGSGTSHGSRFSPGVRKGVQAAEQGVQAGGGDTFTPLDLAVRPLQAFAAGLQQQAEALEVELSRRVSCMEAGFKEERAAMERDLAGERLASNEKVKEAEAQLERLKILAAEKDKAEENARTVKMEKDRASAVFNTSAQKLRAEADSVRERLAKERDSTVAAQKEAAALRTAQQKERAAAQEKLFMLEAELDRERETAKRNQEQIRSESARKTEAQSQAFKLATDSASAAQREREMADAARIDAENRALAAESIATQAAADLTATKERSEAEITAAKLAADAAAAEAARARSSSGIDELKMELATYLSELKAQQKRADALERAKERAEIEAMVRSRGLQELMERNRARYEKTTSALKSEIKELSLLKSAAAGFADLKAKLGMSQTREAELEGQVNSLKMKVEALDKKLADSAEKSAAEAMLLDEKEGALRQVDAQLKAAKERAEALESEVKRVPELTERLEETKAARDAEQKRADELQARSDEAAAKNDQVKERVFDLERSVEAAEWSGRKLAKENEGLQALIMRNRKRFQKELSSLTDASADLEAKTKALEELEAVLSRERDTAANLGKQVTNLKESAAVMASELSDARDKLAQEMAKRMQAESALRSASEWSYKERRRLDDDMAELKTLRVTVGDMELAQKQKDAAWERERSSLTSRLEEAVRSSEGFSTRIAELEGMVEDLRRDSQQNQAKAEALRIQLDSAVSSAGRVDDDKRRLESELEKTKATTLEVKEERNRLQKSVASLMAALEKATGRGEGVSTTALECSTMPTSEEATGSSALPPSGVSTSRASSGPGSGDDGEDPRTIGDDAAGENMRSSAREVQGDEAGKKDDSNAGLGSMRWGPPSNEALQSAREKLSQMAASLLGADGSHAKRYKVLTEADVREADETVSAIDDYLERAQDVVGRVGGGAGLNGVDVAASSSGLDSVSATLPSSTAAGTGKGLEREGHDERHDIENQERSTSRNAWVGSSRWSRQSQ